MALKLTFFGGAETVTGSNFLVEGTKGKLLVDCGIEQGRDFCQADMYAPFAYDVPSLDALVVTHAHLDHVGRIPKLLKEGFKGRIYMTAPTKDLAQLIMEDSARIMAADARDKGLPLLYEERDVAAAMSHIDVIEFHKEWEAAPGLSCYLRNTGHILGSASVRIRDMGDGSDGVTLALTGDIGNTPSPYLPDPEAIDDADVMVMESVYGDRLHTHVDERVDELQKALMEAIKRGGTILIPAFSLERTQLMLYEISNLMDAGKLPKIPVFLDSPLAIKATDVYSKWGSEFFKKDVQAELKHEHDIFRFPMLTQTLTREESEKILEAPEVKIIMAGAGMSHGGRIGRWEQKYLPDPKTTLFMVGYQAPGSPGRILQDGGSQVRLGGNMVTVRGHIQSFSGWSAHADRDGLIAFAEMTQPRTKTIFCALGEPSSARFLAQRLHGFLGVNAIVPVLKQQWEITKQGVKEITH
ncbi:MAG: RNA-metabolising metallo-beta-lactamase, metallo-beta-lactamase family protein [Parcubacteria group bacterium]|nr:RNA-metabolising metallo-beta-lactamase, metallo-beta-lactamase family protein [Parcubacteria group bacterium]